MWHWLFLAFLKQAYYERVAFGNSDIEAESFFPKFRQYWLDQVANLARWVIQRQALFLHQQYCFVALLTFAFIIALWEQIHDPTSLWYRRH